MEAINTLVLLATCLFLLYKLLTYNHDYWKKRNVPYIIPIPPFGNCYPIASFKKSIGEHLTDLYNSRKNDRFFGIFIFNRPHLIIKCPQLVKSILVKDFSNFVNRNMAVSVHDTAPSSMLFISRNPYWKNIRTKLTPFFTSGKLKAMFHLIEDCALDMKNYIAALDHSQTIEAKEICAKYSTDVIAICAFGIKAHTFKSENAEFRQIGKLMFEFTIPRAVQQSSFIFMPTFVNLFRLKLFPDRVIKFLSSVFWATIEQREKNNVKGNDLIDLLIQIRANQEFVKENGFEGEKVVAQAMQFFGAGFETASSTMAFLLYELCIHPEIQAKVRQEIKDAINEEGITYTSIGNMKYLDMCLNETLRKYPTLPFLDRQCQEDYKIPDSDVVIEKGTPIFIPMFGFHYDEKYFKNPDEFIPERFGPDNDINSDGISYMPFGDGPRNCIGARFGIVAAKCGAIHILSQYEVRRAKETPVPLVYEPKAFTLNSKVGLPMQFVKSPLK